MIICDRCSKSYAKNCSIATSVATNLDEDGRLNFNIANRDLCDGCIADFADLVKNFLKPKSRS